MWDFWFVKLVALALDLLGCTRVAVKVTILLGFHTSYYHPPWFSHLTPLQSPSFLVFTPLRFSHLLSNKVGGGMGVAKNSEG